MLKNLLLLVAFLGIIDSVLAQEIFFRVNQAGYLPEETKVAIAFSQTPIKEKIKVLDLESQKQVALLTPKPRTSGNWGNFDYYYELDFSQLKNEGRYQLQSSKSSFRSSSFQIGGGVYQGYAETLLGFMRQQRCGYNPVLDMVCHSEDGRSYYGKVADSTYVDLSGGWHDAGDQLKYLITSSYATAHMLLAYSLYPDQFEDHVNSLGQLGSNGIPDVLDEAKWGLDWILKLHPEPDVLYHQIADDRDHRGFKIPNKDNADYGWGQNSYRAAYAANGKPQGIGKYQSEATGLANIAGRSSAAMALAARIWESHLKDSVFAMQCRKAAFSLYHLGKNNEGYQQGNSFSAPYRYGEDTWADDMEWAAAELYKLTGDAEFLKDAKRYAEITNTKDSWTVMDSASHYQKYPFINIGHFSLHEVVDNEWQKKLEKYYLDGIEYTLKRATDTPFHIGVPFIWCSNNLLTSLITQVILYEKMTGDNRFEPFMTAQKDWLFGRNPWGSSMFTGIPEEGVFPTEVHTAPFVLLGMEVPGGLVDGPIYTSIYNKLLGLTLLKPDPFEKLQNNFVIYHNDVGDYSTNEPTMDGTAGSILMMAHYASKSKRKNNLYNE